MTRSDEMPNLANYSLEDLIEEFGNAKEQQKYYKKLEDYYKEAILARLPDDVDEYEADHYYIERSYQQRTSIDTDRLKQEYGEEWYMNHCRVTEFQVVRCKSLEQGDG